MSRHKTTSKEGHHPLHRDGNAELPAGQGGACPKAIANSHTGSQLPRFCLGIWLGRHVKLLPGTCVTCLLHRRALATRGDKTQTIDLQYIVYSVCMQYISKPWLQNTKLSHSPSLQITSKSFSEHRPQVYLASPVQRLVPLTGKRPRSRCLHVLGFSENNGKCCWRLVRT